MLGRAQMRQVQDRNLLLVEPVRLHARYCNILRSPGREAGEVTVEDLLLAIWHVQERVLGQQEFQRSELVRGRQKRRGRWHGSYVEPHSDGVRSALLLVPADSGHPELEPCTQPVYVFGSGAALYPCGNRVVARLD